MLCCLLVALGLVLVLLAVEEAQGHHPDEARRRQEWNPQVRRVDLATHAWPEVGETLVCATLLFVIKLN